MSTVHSVEVAVLYSTRYLSVFGTELQLRGTLVSPGVPTLMFSGAGGLQ